ncbi:hypothetical protein ISCGN_011259 [Ixodes scapularis]
MLCFCLSVVFSTLRMREVAMRHSKAAVWVPPYAQCETRNVNANAQDFRSLVYAILKLTNSSFSCVLAFFVLSLTSVVVAVVKNVPGLSLLKTQTTPGTMESE